MITLSSRAMLQLLDSLGKGHDAPVLAWTESLLPRLEACVQVQQVRLFGVVGTAITASFS